LFPCHAAATTCCERGNIGFRFNRTNAITARQDATIKRQSAIEKLANGDAAKVFSRREGATKGEFEPRLFKGRRR
jgi:hypothetical protein